MVKKRIYTDVSADAVKGFQRLAVSKQVFVTPAGNGEFTVVTVDKPKQKIAAAA